MRKIFQDLCQLILVSNQPIVKYYKIFEKLLLKHDKLETVQSFQLTCTIFILCRRVYMLSTCTVH